MSTHNIPLSMYKRKSPKIIPNTIISGAMGLFCLGLKSELEIAMVNELPVFEPLNFYFTFFSLTPLASAEKDLGRVVQSIVRLTSSL